MTAAAEIPADVMAAAREVVPGIPNDIWTAASTVATSLLGFGVNRSALLIARAILAERRRCVEAVKAEIIVEEGESYVGLDGFDVDYDRGVYAALRAIQGLQT